MYISLHSFGELILYPWSHTKKPIHDWHELDAMARRWSDVVFQSSNGKYKYRVSNEYINNSMSLINNFIAWREKSSILFLFMCPLRSGQRMITYNIMHMGLPWIGQGETRESNGHFLLSYLHPIPKQELLVDLYSLLKPLYRLPAVYLMASLMLP